MATVRYRPRHVRETIRFDGKLISCTEAVMVMLADAATLGGMRITQLAVRRQSGEWPPDPASPGLNLAQMKKVATHYGLEYTNRTGQPWESVRDAIGFARVVQASVIWSELGTGGTNIAHSILVQYIDDDGRTLINDPMHTKEEWVPTANVRRAMEAMAVRVGNPRDALLFGASRAIPRVEA